MQELLNNQPIHKMNPFFSTCFKEFSQSICSKLFDSTISPRTKAYIQECVGTTEALLGVGKIHSIILFGSVAQKQTTILSDVDLLIIVDDSISQQQIRRIDPILRGIEIKHRYSFINGNWVSMILRIVEKTTGMFCSHFICRKDDWDHQRFARIFSTNRIITKLLAPDKIVLGSVITSGKELYGKLLTNLKNSLPPASHYQLLKSLIMDLLISLGSFLAYPMRHNAIKYGLEAFKWALRSGIYYLFHNSRTISSSLNVYQRLGFPQKILDRFRKLRASPRLDFQFALTLPINILRIHMLSYRYKKMFNK